MTTKQWIGIEEAAKKYQVSSRRINTWCKKQEITCSEIDHYLMLDEDSLLRGNLLTTVYERTYSGNASDNKRTCRNDTER